MGACRRNYICRHLCICWNIKLIVVMLATICSRHESWMELIHNKILIAILESVEDLGFDGIEVVLSQILTTVTSQIVV